MFESCHCKDQQLGKSQFIVKKPVKHIGKYFLILQ